jgi:hypothetical protein
MTPSPYAAAIRSTRNRRRHALTSATRWTIAAAALAIAAAGIAAALL